MTTKREEVKGGVSTEATTNGESSRSPGGRKVKLGTIVCTDSAMEALHSDDVFTALRRHMSGDWGDVLDEDWRENDRGLVEGKRIHSSYRDRNQKRFWVITDLDRSLTTICLPDDY